MHGQYEMQKDLLLKMTKEMLKLKEEKKELFAINFVCKIFNSLTYFFLFRTWQTKSKKFNQAK